MHVAALSSAVAASEADDAAGHTDICGLHPAHALQPIDSGSSSCDTRLYDQGRLDDCICCMAALDVEHGAAMELLGAVITDLHKQASKHSSKVVLLLALQ